MTQYMDYHPGGWDEQVRGAGRDATDMFNEIHKWVNYQGMMEACLVGKLVDGPSEEVKAPPKMSGPALLPPPGAESETRETEMSPSDRFFNRITTVCSGFCAGKIILSRCSLSSRIAYKSNLKSLFPPVLPPIKVKPAAPTMDFFQTETKLTVNIYTKR